MNKILSQAIKKAVSEYSPEVREVPKNNRPDLRNLLSASNIIRRVQVDQYADLPVNAPKREQRYSVTPTPSNVAPTAFDPSDEDNFGFNEVTSFFQDAKNYDEKTGTDTDDA